METLEPNLSRGMREANGVYTQAFNRRHGRVGHLLQGRYKAQLVDKVRQGAIFTLFSPDKLLKRNQFCL